MQRPIEAERLQRLREGHLLRLPKQRLRLCPVQPPGGCDPGIWTTDRLGNFGYNPGDVRFGDVAGKFTNDFGGTSSACPGAAGVAALVLSANSALRWNEVKDILRRACDRIDPQGGQYDANGHSKFYGHGRLNAETAAKLAKGEVARVVIVNKVQRAHP